ncbi:peptidylprolyl isomerase [Methylotenera versatilis]|jgi:peptidyl-prolyl cis-trans isomerase A (cyclophilin A)|uniref:Peptidyl-prolyl cis-trans isomerase n=1 Tax=Methylotenera versatilis (strain 301) TaxID=666681 RepID=D7DMV9_METV0|nr:peptidylprolyl isomerase [Methylotenera versatilis]ADI28898.1 peptidyl-prolyl cis-trans isomerase cyclophilin type [Methylotenera versatilis 301]
MRKFYAVAILAVSSAFAVFSTSAIAANPQVTFETNRGNFVVELYPEKAPKTVANFLKYVNSGFYKETTFHRVINHFMIQGGGFNADMSEKQTLAPISNEAANGLKNEIGTIAMARTSDPDSATAQFFINLENNVQLNYQGPDPELIGYCVFGRVLKGMDVVREIGITPTINVGQYYDVPKSAIVIHQVKLNTNATNN